MKIKRKKLEALLDAWEKASEELMKENAALGYDEGWRDGKAEGLDTAVGMLSVVVEGKSLR